MLSLSMDIIAEELKDVISESRMREDTAMNLEGVRFMERAEAALSSNMLYIVLRAYMYTPGGGVDSLNLLYWGDEPVDAFPHSCNVLKIDEAYDISTVMNRLLDVFLKYRTWKDELDRLLKDHAPLEEFLNVSQPIFKSGIVLMDWDHNRIAMTRNVQMENCPLWNAILDGYGYKYSFVIENSRPYLADITKNRTMHQNWSNLDNRYLYNAPLFINGLPMYGIGLHKIEEPEKPFGRHISHLLGVLAEIYTERLSSDATNRVTHNTLYETFIRDAITGKLQNPEEVNEKNHFIPRKEEEYLVAGVIAFKDIKYRTSFLASCARELAAYWPGSGCSVVGCELLWIVNLGNEVAFEFLPASEQKRLQQWLEAKKACCGFSCAFKKLADLRKGYQQAKTTLHYGIINDHDRGVHIFNYFDHFDWQLVEMAAAMTDLSVLIHPVIHTLINFDQQHNTDYYETLREYLLNDSNLTLNEMADKLHIHRNTLRYRLDRICEITQLDLKSTALKQQMLLSIYCFDLFPKNRQKM